MTSVRGRGRGMGGGRGGNVGAGGGDRPGQDNQNRRGSWRGGPPGSNGSAGPPRGGSPAQAPTTARTSINDHMNLMGKVTDDRARTPTAKGFQTDTDISSGKQGAHRELQPWTPDAPTPNGTNGSAKAGGNKDSETFGLEQGGNVPWDQFETNARLFGATTDYKEEIYTTKLDRSGAGYKQREKEATRLASEIMGQTATNSHIAEERNQAVDGGAKDEEEKYSGVQRAPNAYVPPGARRSAGQGAVAARPTPAAPAVVPSLKVNGSTPAPAQQAQTPKPAQPAQVAQSPNNSQVEGKSSTPAAPPAVPSTNDAPPVADKAQGAKASTPSPQPETAAKDEKPASVVDQFRFFVGSEREKVEAKKQSMVKQERERTLADLKKFQSNFKVPLPIPKDILPLLAKDAEKQKAIEEKAALALEDAKRKPEPAAPKPAQSPSQSRKISMKIPEIPPFKPKKAPTPPVLPISDSASKDIPLAASPTPSTASQLGGNQSQAKLNPNANSFVFKPNPAAAAFKPGQPSTAATPSPKPAQSQLPPISAVAGPSAPPKNPFFREQPPPLKGIDSRSDFNPWKQGPLPAASSINPQWPYTGRKYNAAFVPGPMHGSIGGFDDEQGPNHAMPPHIIPGMPPNYPPYGYRFQPGMPPQGMPNQMFSPGSQFQQLPSGPIPGQGHLGGPPPNGPIGMPMHFYQNGMPQNSQFMPPHLPFNPNARGPSGPVGHGNPMFFQQHQHQHQQHQHQHSNSTPHQTPQMHQASVQQQQPPFSTSPIPPPQPHLASNGNSFDKSENGGH